MNIFSAIWRCIIILLTFSLNRCPLLPAGSQRFNGLGYLTVEPAPLFLIGSNLTVYCHVTKCQHGFTISLELNGQTVDARKKVNCTTMVFNLLNVQTPRLEVLCKLKGDQLSKIVNGLELHGGLPPDKPKSINCETTRSSDAVGCSWKKGQETYLPTTFNISVNRENGIQIHLAQTRHENITIPRGILDENTKYHLIVTAYNHFGASQELFILCVKDIVIPETPQIMQIEFGNSSIATMLQWKTPESSVHLRPNIRLHTDNGSWEVKEGTELNEGLIRLDNLRPLTDYEFQLRTCFTPSLTSTKRSVCSKWSLSMRGRSPGKGPSQQLHVWRVFRSHATNRLQVVTVLWKPPSREDYSGEVQQYKMFLVNGQTQNVTCAAALSQCSVQVPAEVQALSISAVTLYGTSPPADVPLRHSGVFGPVLREVAPAVNGSAVLVSWSWPGTKQRSASGDLLYYVIEWTSVPAAELQWQKLPKDQNNTSIPGLKAGVRYNISLYAVTTRGVCVPSSGLVYSKEQKPASSPNMLVLIHEARRVLIQWHELPVDQQRGFITNYTIYVQTLDSSKTERSVMVPASSPRQMWIDCSEETVALELTASNSVGEGPRARRISSLPAAPPVGPVIVTVFIITLFMAIIANLMCWSCVRKRVKQKCISWGPAGLVENLPKLGNSNAIRLLEEDRGEPSFSSTHSDPPLSPISLISWEERNEVYPTIQVEVSQPDFGPAVAETPLLTLDCGTMLVGSQLEHVSYKPQVATFALQGEEVKETEEEQRDISVSGEEDICSSVYGGLLRGLLSNVEVKFSDSPLVLTLSSVNGLLWPKTEAVLNRGVLSGMTGTENDVGVDFPSLELQQDEKMSCDVSQYTIEKTLTDAYFPQVAIVSSSTLCNSHR